MLKPTTASTVPELCRYPGREVARLPESSFEVEAGDSGQRLDRLISTRLSVSRSVAQRLSRSGSVLVDGEAANPSHKAHTGEKVDVTLPDTELKPEDIHEHRA